jgi:hypothetical protein
VTEGSSQDLAQVMGLESEGLARVALRTEQWAAALERGLEETRPEASPAQREFRHREVASLFTIAGSYRLLLGARESG